MLLTQFGLLTQGRGFDDWANILFIVVMVVLWLLAGLVKTISKKGPPQEQQDREGATGQRRRPGETWQQRLARRAEDLQRMLEEGAGVAEPRKRPPRAPEASAQAPQAPGGKITHRPGQRGESVIVYERPQPSTRPEPQVATGPYAAKTVPVETPLEPDGVQLNTLRESGGFDPAVIIDYSDPDAIKKAILHYEILGRPLALRDTPDPTSAF